MQSILAAMIQQHFRFEWLSQKPLCILEARCKDISLKLDDHILFMSLKMIYSELSLWFRFKPNFDSYLKVGNACL